MSKSRKKITALISSLLIFGQLTTMNFESFARNSDDCTQFVRELTGSPYARVVYSNDLDDVARKQIVEGIKKNEICRLPNRILLKLRWGEELSDYDKDGNPIMYCVDNDNTFGGVSVDLHPCVAKYGDLKLPNKPVYGYVRNSNLKNNLVRVYDYEGREAAWAGGSLKGCRIILYNDSPLLPFMPDWTERFGNVAKEKNDNLDVSNSGLQKTEENTSSKSENGILQNSDVLSESSSESESDTESLSLSSNMNNSEYENDSDENSSLNSSISETVSNSSNNDENSLTKKNTDGNIQKQDVNNKTVNSDPKLKNDDDSIDKTQKNIDDNKKKAVNKLVNVLKKHGGKIGFSSLAIAAAGVTGVKMAQQNMNNKYNTKHEVIRLKKNNNS